uniref:Ig-like domain-containing protein n=1 Tax=Oreochromis aureus TaxID=47969 RepID=A0AAZ1X7B0_OREAU
MMGHSLLCMMGFFLLSTVICGNDEDNTTHSQDADKSEEEQTTSVPIKPTVTLQPSWPQIYSGETVTVRCEIQGGEGAQWTYGWRRDQVNIGETSSEYRIITVSESDSGGYSCCVGRSSSWTEWSDTITLRVIAPPKPTVTLQHNWPQIYSGETVTVRCEIQGGEGAQWTYEWRRGQSSIRSASSEYRTISATESDSGGYSCRGRRGSSWTEWSDITTLTVLPPPKLTVILQPSMTQIYSGETVTVRCEIQGGEGAQWTYEWSPAKLNTHETSSEYRIIRATESDSGGYSCRGKRSFSWTKWSDITTLTVLSPPKPTVFLQHDWPQIYSGETVTVRCEIQGGEGAQWTYEWRRDHSNIGSASSEYRTIRATESDSGGYSCRGKRSSSWTEWSDITTLTVLCPPKPTVTLQPSWTQIYSGETVTVTCEIQGGEGAQWTYEWRPDKLNKRPTSNNYRIITVTQSDSGGYSCQGRRGSFYTQWSDSITLTVSSPPKPTVTLQPSWTQIYRGETVTVRCEIQGGEGAQWTYEWRRGHSNIGSASREYTINKVTESNAGEYSCRGKRSFSWTKWSDITTLTVLSPPKPTVTLQPSWTQIYRDTTVTVRCEIHGGERAQWTYEWRRGQKNIPETSSVYTINRVTESDGGGYSCRATRSSSWTEWSDITTLRVTVPIKPTVTLQPSWTQIYSGETVTVRCEIQGGEGAQWTYEWRPAKLNTPPTSNEYRIITVPQSDRGGYSCRGIRDYLLTEWSDIIRLTVLNKPRPVLTVSPSWLSPGASVTLNCEVEHPSAGWSFYWYKAVPKLKTYNYKSSSYELLPDGSGTAQDSYIIHGQTHTAGYVCRAGRGDPEYHTDHSQPKFVWSADVHSAASLTVSPDRVQHFTSDSVSLTCEGNFTEWRVKKFSEDGRLYSDCRRMTGSTCNINTSKSDTAVYWCESGSGEFSGAVNITVQNYYDYHYYYYYVPILVSPVHPVTEGASVSLSCSLKTQKILSNVFFYHNHKLIQNDTRGELKISAVSKSDEGFYKCQYSGRESAQSWMSVKVTASGADSSSSPVWLMVGLVCGVSLIIILLLLLYRCRQSKYSCFTRSIQSESHSPGSSTNHGVNQNETHEYNSLHPGTNHIYESVTQVEDNRNGSDEHQDVTYALIELKNFGKKRKHHKPEQSAVYSEVKTGAAEDSLMYAEVKRPKKEKAKKKAGKSSPAADAAVYSEVTLGSFPGQ